ncbi:MAG: protein-ER retention protein [Alyxoria varia]|nr:MAG: protein-ER retention protein [Alyxoria varia]
MALVDRDISTIGLVLPLPYRVAVLIVAAIWGWGLNLHYLSRRKIDVPALINYPSGAHYESTYRLAALVTAPLIFSLLLFWTFTYFQAERVIAWQILPLSYLAALLVAFLLPLRQLAIRGRQRFFATFLRISYGGIAHAGEGKFGDIILADVLTSYSKIIVDVFAVICMATSRQSCTAKPDRICGGVSAFPFLLLVPTVIRMRQCYTEYARVRDGVADGSLDSNRVGWGGQHLANLIKYATAIPVVVLSVLQLIVEPSGFDPSHWSVFYLWCVSHLWGFLNAYQDIAYDSLTSSFYRIIAALVNSLYSFYWDVAKDWDIPLFSSLHTTLLERHPSGYKPLSTAISPTHEPTAPFGLRHTRLFPGTTTYYTVIVVDLFLRLSWVYKFSPHLDYFLDSEGMIFTLEIFEVFRRWLWIFLRVEAECIRHGGVGTGGGAISLDVLDQSDD